MTTNLHDKMLAAIDALFSASDAVEEEVAENLLLDVRDEINKYKLAAKSLTEGLRLDDWDKIGCVNHDCDQCKAQQEPVAWVCEGSSSDEKHAIDYWPGDVDDIPIGTKLYTSPQAQPLTDDKYEALVEDLADWSRYVEVDTAHQSLEKHVRQMLAAHGITKGNT